MDQPAEHVGQRSQKPTGRRDLLHEHHRIVAVALAILAAALLFASIEAGVSGGLPTAAFGWRLGIEVIRAAVAFGIIAVVAIVIIRGWGGLWPKSISTTSIDWEELSQGTTEYAQARGTVDRVSAEIEALAERAVRMPPEGREQQL